MPLAPIIIIIILIIIAVTQVISNRANTIISLTKKL